jgi:hypothetical protein
MRLPKVATGQRLPQKALLLMVRMIAMISGDPVSPSDIMRAVLYRPELFGKPYSDLVHALLRGPSDWSAGERELFAAFTSRLNSCRF